MKKQPQNSIFDLKKSAAVNAYNAQSIEVLEGLEPVRLRPGMYIGGTDSNALHHLVNEIIDNAMDEVIAGFASEIEFSLLDSNTVAISDNGRGIPVDQHPKFPEKSALEVILTMLHSGGKFNNKIYKTSAGLHGVGLSVVNALSEKLEIKVLRDNKIYLQNYSRGIPKSQLLEQKNNSSQKKGTMITFSPDPEIFQDCNFVPERLYNLIKSKAYLYAGVKIKWTCLIDSPNIPTNEIICYNHGLQDFLKTTLHGKDLISADFFCGKLANESQVNHYKIEWAATWCSSHEQSFIKSYCNTVATPQGGTHEQGFKNILVKCLKEYFDKTNQSKKLQNIIPEDVFIGLCAVISIFIANPQFQGQTKEKLVNTEATKLVENSLKDYFDHWLYQNKDRANNLVNLILSNAEFRINARNDREVNRKTVINKLRLPGKLTDCLAKDRKNTELFIVEGDSAGGSAKQARDRNFQAILPLRGKILNVASNSLDKIKANQELNDLEIALGCGSGNHYHHDKLRYDKIIIMTDADVDGAHIASLLLTFFLNKMPELVTKGHLYIAKPPLYRLVVSNKTYYAADDHERNILQKKYHKNKIEVGRFKGLGEMTAPQLKETTMNPNTRTLFKVTCTEINEAFEVSDRLMGRKPEHRFNFIQQQINQQGKTVLQELDI